MSAQQTKPKRHALQETPVTEITAIKDNIPVVILKIFRRAPNGTLATIDASMSMETLQLLDGTLEKYLEAKGGGGTYTVEARDPADPSNEVLPRFLVTILGAPKDPRHVPQAAVHQAMYQQGGMYAAPPVGMPNMPGMQGPPMQGMGGIQAPPAAYQMPGVAVPQYQGPGQVSLPPPDALPPWARSYDPSAQWKLYYQALEQSGRLPAGSSIHSDALASQHASTWQAQFSGEHAQNAKLREKLESMEARRLEEQARYQKEIENLRVQQEAQKREGEMAALRAEIASLRDSRNSGGGIEWGTVIAASVPLVSALVGFLSERARADALMQVETRKLEAKQQESMLMLMAPKDNGSMLDKVMPLLPALAPIITKFMENNGTLAQAELIEMRNNGQMMQIKMLHDMIQDLRNEGEPPPPWMPALEGILGAVQGYAQMKAMQPQPQANGAQPVQRKVAAPLPSAATASEAQIWNGLAEIDQQAAHWTQVVWAAVPDDFHTQEWRVLIFNIHLRSPVAEVAENLVDYLAHLQRYDMLPPPLAEVFKDAAGVEAIVMALPIAKMDPEYTEALIATVKQLLAEVEVEDEAEEPEDASYVDVGDEEPSGAVVAAE